MHVSKRNVSFLIMGLMIWGFLQSVCFSINTPRRIEMRTNIALTPMASTNPSAPDYLTDDFSVYEYYGSTSTNYYYDTYTMGSYDYHLIWLYTESSSDDFDLALFSDSGYSNQVGASASSSQWDWIVYRPLVDQKMYPRVYTFSGTGYAYIEAESSWDISVGSTSYSEWYEEAETGAIFEVYLNAGTTYVVTLNVPSGANLDLYVCRVAPGTTTKQDYYTSTSSYYGQSERIVFNPTYTDYYAIIVLRKGGSGSGNVTIQIPTYIPSFELILASFVLLGIAVAWRFIKQIKAPLY
ncbi:MAG: hypothetical protein ACTSRS_20410 [Candidatus Helarchaeota archaeon]